MSSAIQRYPGLDKILEKHTDQVGGRYLNQKKRHFIKKKSSLSPHSQYWRKKYHKYRHKVKMLEGGSQAIADISRARALAQAKAQETTRLGTAENTVLQQAKVAESDVDKAIQKLRNVLAEKLKELLQEDSQFRKDIPRYKGLETLIPYLKALEALVGTDQKLSADQKRHAVSLLLVGNPTAERFTEKHELAAAETNILTELRKVSESSKVETLQTFLARGLIQDLEKIKIETSTVATEAESTQSAQATQIGSVETRLKITLTLLRKLCQSIYDAYSREASIKGAIEAKTIFFKIRAVKLCQQSCQGQKVAKSPGFVGFFKNENTYEQMYASLYKRYQEMTKKLKIFKKIATNLNITSTSYNSNTVTDTNKDIVELGEQLNKFMKQEVVIDDIEVPISNVVKDAENNLSNLIKTLRDVKIGTKMMPSRFGRESTKEREKRKTAMQIANAKGGAAGAAGAAGESAEGATEDGKELSSNIEQEGENFFFQSFQLEDSLKDILKSSIFRYHPYFVQLPKDLETIRQLMEGLPATAKRVVTRNQNTFKQIKKYQVEITELLEKITAHKKQIKQEVDGFLQKIGLQENEIPATLFEAKDGVIKTKVVETVAQLTKKIPSNTNQDELEVYFKKLQCYSCSEFNIKQLTFMDIFENEIKGECPKQPCPRLDSAECAKYKLDQRIKRVAEQLCGLINGTKNKYCEIAGHCLLVANYANSEVNNHHIDIHGLKERICAVAIRQKAIEMGCALLEKYLMEHKIESIHKYRLSEGDTSQHITQAEELQEERANQTTKEQQAAELQQQAAELQQQALVTAEKRGRDSERAQTRVNQEAIEAAEEAKTKIKKSGGLLGPNKTKTINDQLTIFNDEHAGKLANHNDYLKHVRNTMNVPESHKENVLTLEQHKQKQQEYVEQNKALQQPSEQMSST